MCNCWNWWSWNFQLFRNLQFFRDLHWDLWNFPLFRVLVSPVSSVKDILLINEKLINTGLVKLKDNVEYLAPFTKRLSKCTNLLYIFMEIQQFKEHIKIFKNHDMMNECKRLTTIKLCFYPVILFCFHIFIQIFYNIQKAPYFCFYLSNFLQKSIKLSQKACELTANIFKNPKHIRLSLYLALCKFVASLTFSHLLLVAFGGSQAWQVWLSLS